MTADFFSDCLLLADDFTQYWLGAYDRGGARRERQSPGHGGAARRLRGALRRTGDDRQPDRRGGGVRRRRATCCRSTSSRSSRAGASADYTDPRADRRRSRASGRRPPTHVDDGYQRLSRTFDLTGVERGATRRRSRRRSPTTPRTRLRQRHRRGAPGRARTTGRRCPTSTAARRPTVPAECEAGFYVGGAPAAADTTSRWATPCLPTGTTGEWNSLTGSTGGLDPRCRSTSAAYAGSAGRGRRSAT